METIKGTRSTKQKRLSEMLKPHAGLLEIETPKAHSPNTNWIK